MMSRWMFGVPPPITCARPTRGHRKWHAVELIGRRWTGAILRALLVGVSRFSELVETIPGLSPRMLSERLKELEAEGVVVRRRKAWRSAPPSRLKSNRRSLRLSKVRVGESGC